MNLQKIGNRTILWTRNHKFWTSALVLLIIAMAVRFFGPGVSIGPWRVSYLFFFGLLFYYTLIGGLIWSGYARKKGMTIITLGIYFALISLYSWWLIISRWEFEAAGFSIALIFSLLSISLLFLGIKRYRRWLSGI